MTVTIYHNPGCGASRNPLAMFRQSREEPVVIEYFGTPPNRTRLIELIKTMGVVKEDGEVVIYETGWRIA